MLQRNRVLLLTSLGLALISILVFGWLFGGGTSPQVRLGVVDEDGTVVAGQVVADLRGNAALAIATGTRDEELNALRDGHRDAVVVLAAGFGSDLAAGHGRLQVYYDQSSPITLATTRAAVVSIVAGINSGLTHQSPALTIDEQAVSVRALRQIDWLTPGQLGMMLMWANLSVGVMLVDWRQQGILRRLAATPLGPGTVVGSQILARVVLSFVQAAILLAVAVLAFHVPIVGNWGLLALAVFVGALTMLGVGFAIGSFARDADVAQAVVILVSFPMMFLGGVYFPTDSAPVFLKPVIEALPLTYLNDALRQIVNNGAGLAAIQHDLLILSAWLVASLIVSVRIFRWS
jgi:ABC-2 type transport system permease protein